jgi:hypothetical protein
MRRLQGTSRRSNRIQDIAKWKQSKDRIEICRFIEPIAAARCAKMD